MNVPLFYVVAAAIVVLAWWSIAREVRAHPHGYGGCVLLPCWALALALLALACVLWMPGAFG